LKRKIAYFKGFRVDVECRVLHVFSQPTALSDAFETTFSACQWVSTVVPDCYSALATVVQPDARFDLVLVALDGLGATEAEFFELAAQRFREMPVLIYGESGAIDANWAIDRGARLAGDPQELMTLLGGAVSAETGRSESSPPLLSTEELQALLGDEPENT
jgi:hypothetical protein